MVSLVVLIIYFIINGAASLAAPMHPYGEKIQLPGASGSGPYEVLVDWIAAFEAKHSEVDITVSSVGSGASQSALWGDIDCISKPIEALCKVRMVPESQPRYSDDIMQGDDSETTTKATRTIWGMGGASLAEAHYIDHEDLDLQMLPAIGGPVLPVYSKDVTGNLGRDGDAGLNMTFDVMVGIFNGSIASWRDPSIMNLNPNLNLPKELITVLVREDKSGMTETLTQSMAKSAPTWPQKAVGKLPNWPLHLTHASTDSTSCKTDLAGIHHFKADGQTGIGLGLLRRPYSIGYVELGYFGQLTSFVSQVHMSSAVHPDKFVAATSDTIATTMDGLVDVLDPATLEVNLAEEDTPVGGYPISRYVYWYIKKNYTEFMSCYQAWLLCTFIKWTFEDPLAAEIASKHGWTVPPASVVSKALEKLNEVQCIDNTGTDGTTTESIIISALDYQPPKYHINLNQIDTIRPVGLVLSAIVILSSSFFFLWVVWKRKLRIVRASQPEFLMMICCGTCVMGAAIIPITIDDSITTVARCNMACMSFPWLTCCGFTIAFSALFSKIWRISKLFHRRQFRRVEVKSKDALIPFAAMFTMNITLLFAWTITDPLQWNREMLDSVNSVGKCGNTKGPVSTVFVTLLVAVNFSALIIANVQAYKARGISDEFSESKYVAIAMASALQVLLISLPLAALVEENPPARLFVQAGILFVISMSLLLLVFIPKICYVLKGDVTMQGHSESFTLRGINGSTRITGFDVYSSVSEGSTSCLDRSNLWLLLLLLLWGENIIMPMIMVAQEITIEGKSGFDDDDDGAMEPCGAAIVSHPELQKQIEDKNKFLIEENGTLQKRIKEMERELRAIEHLQRQKLQQQSSLFWGMNSNNLHQQLGAGPK